ncbi:MAG: glycosyltransferase [Ilumatobacteraceae bacterium]
MTPLLLVVGGVYAILTVLLIGFGANLAYYAFVVWRRPPRATPSPAGDGPLPKVTVQLPVYNEMYVSERVIEAACALDYPRDLLEIQVLDDSTDATTRIVDRAVRRARAEGIDIVHVRRDDRTGFKAGALANGLQRAAGELVAIFDADFVPPPDFLHRTVPHFADDEIAFVQGRWGHLNREQSWLTRLQALAIDGHFMVEQAARGARGYWFNFNGTAGIWRVAAIEDAGGWTADTLAEDLDLSYRAHLRGWRGRYLEDLVVPGEVPVQMSGFRRQQHRWARGSLECAIRLGPRIWGSEARTGVRFQATAHLTSYAIHLLLFGVTMLYPFVVLAAAEYPEFRTFFGVAYPFALFSLAPIAFFVAGQHRLGRSSWRELPRILSVTLIGPGMMMNTVRAAAQIVTEPAPEFERTAKFGDDRTTAHEWTHKRYQLGLDRIVFAELFVGLYALGAAWLAFQHQNWAVLTYAAIFGTGLLLVSSLTVAQTLVLHRQRAARDSQRDREDLALSDLEPTRAATTR